LGRANRQDFNRKRRARWLTADNNGAKVVALLAQAATIMLN
jgi:hypothetical protein